MAVRVPIMMSVGFALVAVSPATAQMRSTPAISTAAGDEDDAQPVQQQRQAPIDANQPGRAARSAVGQVGERQTRDTVGQAGIRPMARITSRIQNRVQNRIRNRIDRNYDPQANATDPFAVANEQNRTTLRQR